MTFDTIDLTSTPSVTITGDFDIEGFLLGDASPFLFTAPDFGTFAGDPADGTFTYTVTQAEALAAASGGTATGTGTVSDGNDTDTFTFNFTVCFARGTRIATLDGERPVEDLREGDLVLTADGRAVPVMWMGVNAISPMSSLPIGWSPS